MFSSFLSDIVVAIFDLRMLWKCNLIKVVNSKNWCKICLLKDSYCLVGYCKCSNKHPVSNKCANKCAPPLTYFYILKHLLGYLFFVTLNCQIFLKIQQLSPLMVKSVEITLALFHNGSKNAKKIKNGGSEIQNHQFWGKYCYRVAIISYVT